TKGFRRLWRAPMREPVLHPIRHLLLDDSRGPPIPARPQFLSADLAPEPSLPPLGRGGWRPLLSNPPPPPPPPTLPRHAPPPPTPLAPPDRPYGASQSFTVRSNPAVAIRLPSGEKATARTLPSCARTVPSALQVATSQARSRPVSVPATRRRLSGVNDSARIP